MAHRDKNSGVEDYKLKLKRLIIPFAITHHATPASKVHAADLAALVLSTEGKTAVATAADSGTNFTTEADTTGIFGILVKDLGTVEKVLTATMVSLSSGTATVTAVGASSSGVTASGNIALSIDWSGSLASTDLSGTLVIDYRVSKA